MTQIAGNPYRRREIEKKARFILTESTANAKKRVQELERMVRDGNESVRQELQQARAILRPKLTGD